MISAYSRIHTSAPTWSTRFESSHPLSMPKPDAAPDRYGDLGVDYRDPNNQRLNKAVLGFHRTHMFISNGTFELPFGPGRPLLGNAPGWIKRLTERWQLGGIFNLTSGAPFSVTASVSTIAQATSQATIVSTPNIVGKFP